MGMRTDPDAAALMAGELASDNNAHLSDALGRTPEPVDLYLAHFLGASGASDFLKAWSVNPDQPAAPLFAKAAAANRPIFYDAGGAPRTLDQIRRSFAAKLGRDAGPAFLSPPATQHRLTASSLPDRSPLEMRQIEPMPQKLSLDFARDAYRKLSGLGGVAG